MTNFLIKAVRIINPLSEYHLEVCDVRIKQGKLMSIEKTTNNNNIEGSGDLIDGSNKFLSPSFVDCAFWQGEPGNERAESLSSSADLAFDAGFGHLLIMPDLSPATETSVTTGFFNRKSEIYGIDFHPVARVTTRENPNSTLTEMLDISNEGAIAFSNGDTPVSNLGLFTRALQYSSMTGKLFMNAPQELQISENGQLHSSLISETMGIAGVMPHEEYLALRAQIDLARHYDSPYFAMNISSKESVQCLKEAANTSSKVYSSVPILNLLHTITDMQEYDTNIKLWPVLRSEEDKQALIEALKSGLIDLVASNHHPVSIEDKLKEFEYAKFGAITLSLVAPLLNGILGDHQELLVDILSLRPRVVFDLPKVEFKVGESVDYVLFDPNKKWIYNKASNPSKSENTSYFDKELTGKSIALFRNKKTFIHER